MNHYARLIAEVRATPWAIVPSRLVDIVDVLAYQAQGGKLSADEIEALVGVQAHRGDRVSDRGHGVAVLSLRGIVANRIEQVDNISGPGGTSTELFSARFQAMLANDAAEFIVIDIDSPGGSVAGVPELANEIRNARGVKPVIAIANSLAASAAYWIASAADEVSVTPSGEVGSIGVFTSHTDISGRMEQRGESTELISAGRFKIERHPFGPLSDEAREHLQARVDAIYHEFLDAVALGRDVNTSAVLHNFGEGRTVTAVDALAAGMVDRVETMDELLARLGVGPQPNTGRARGSTSRLVPGAFQFLRSADLA